MPIFRMYYANEERAVRTFHDQLMIIRELATDALLLQADSDTATPGGGEIMVWVKGASYFPRLAAVREDWQITLDREALPLQVYFELDVDGKQLELTYKAYRFTCSFPKFDVAPGSDLAQIRARFGKED